MRATRQQLFGVHSMSTLLLCIIFAPNFLHAQLSAVIKYEYYSPSSNYSNRSEESQMNGVVSTRGSQIPVRNKPAFTMVDAKNNYDACQEPINATNYSEGIAILQRGGDCTFSMKITRAKQHGAAAVIIYDPRSTGLEAYDMLQNNSDILALYVPQPLGAMLFSLANDNQTYLNITLEPSNVEYDDSTHQGVWYNSRGAIVFVAVSISVLVFLCIAWFVFYYCQRYRSRTAKDHLNNRLTHAAKKALTKIPLITITETPPIEESCVICLDTLKAGDTVRQLKCTHTFHQTCVDPWLINHRHCPLCNLDILVAYGVAIPGTNSRRHPTVSDNLPPVSYTSLAIIAASPVLDQTDRFPDQQLRQASIAMPAESIPTISGSIGGDLHGEQNTVFRADDEH